MQLPCENKIAKYTAYARIQRKHAATLLMILLNLKLTETRVSGVVHRNLQRAGVDQQSTPREWL